MNLSPKTLTGFLHLDNKGACDWGYQGLLAHGCHEYITIIDPRTIQTVQTLGGHEAYVSQVRWHREKYHHICTTDGYSYGVVLASADVAGNIKVWDVAKGQAIADFNYNNKPLQMIEWLPGFDTSPDLLVTLHSREFLVLWNGLTGTQIWAKSFFEGVDMFALDPFNIHNMALLCETQQVIVIEDISLSAPPSDNYRTIPLQNMSPSFSPSSSSQSFASSSGNSRVKKNTTPDSWGSKVVSLASNIQSGITGKRQSISDEDLVSTCVQMLYNPALRNMMFLVFPRQIHILDLDADLTVGVIRLDRVTSNFTKIFLCKWTNCVYCLHENGCVTARVCRSSSVTMATDINTDPFMQSRGNAPGGPVTMETFMSYDIMGQSDLLRLLHNVKIYNFACNTVTERSVAIGLSDGRVFFMDVILHQGNGNISANLNYSFTLADMIGRSKVLRPGDINNLKKGRGVTLRLVVTGLIGGIIPSPTVMKRIPGKNYSDQCGSLLAIGSSLGMVQLVNVQSGQIEKEFQLSMSPIRGIQWVNHEKFITYATPNPGPYNREVSSQIMMVYITSGTVKMITDGKSKEQTGPVVSLRVSPDRNFMSVIYKHKPFEIWTLDNLTLCKEVTTKTDKLTKATAQGWVPSSSQVKIEADADGYQIPDKGVSSETFLQQVFISAFHEFGFLSRISLQPDSQFKLARLHTEYLLGVKSLKTKVTALSWKEKKMIFATTGGLLYLMDGSAKKQAIKLNDRGSNVAKAIKFAPGKMNLHFLVLYEDCVMIWKIVLPVIGPDGETPTKAVWVKTSPKFSVPVSDSEWVGYASPSVLTTDGCLHIFEKDFRTKFSPITELALAEPLLCPGLMNKKYVFLLKYQLQCGIHDNQDSNQISHRLSDLKSLLDNNEAYESVASIKIGTAERCHNISRLFGDEMDTEFWRLALYQMQTGQMDTTQHAKEFVSYSEASSDLTKLFSIPSKPREPEVNPLINWETISDTHITLETTLDTRQKDQDVKPLESCFDVLCDAVWYKNLQKAWLHRQNQKRESYTHKRQCASRYIMLDEPDMAVQVLMETDMNDEAYVKDCLKACLVSSVRTSSASLGTIKLAATHLIAAGNHYDGIELLCLINMPTDACKYFMSLGMWQQAVWLAKTTLKDPQYMEIMFKWSEHLWSNNERNKAVLVMMSLGQYIRVLQMLLFLKQYDRAAMFLQACLENKLVQKDASTEKLFEAINLCFAKILSISGYKEAVKFYCQLAGSKGETFLRGSQT